ncbi:MAG: hypothetical protein A2172_02305 [Candidatus Woykebacteria bacterium RBG_13_40_15]|uniref:Pyridoxamine 5'-phosphate oxidase N-terminal domain-containing protein n=1 Tax=Candidatus Woykebacteria bacterium RBG_13_40_15 TaxID=1802593 RepID=A0A1G1W6A5_9BACT|nr:MAG: hypothetical protein A2172_02305 [Candidatus Woykebacteria bacterium RBG_13_40_15]
MDLKKLIKDYLKETNLMQIATAKGNKPWIASVWFAYDSAFNLYFISRFNRRHSLEIAKNPHVAGAIVKPHKTLGDKTRGLQFEGECHEVKGVELVKAFAIFAKRFPTVTKFILSPKDIVEGVTDHHFYKVVPSQIVLFDEVNFPDQSRRELNL